MPLRERRCTKTVFMSLGAQLPIRLEPEVQERLEVIAQEIGTSKSALLRLLARTFVEQAVDAHGKVHLPPNWKDILGRLPPADGRSPSTRRGTTPAVEVSSKPNAAATNLLKRHVPSSAPGRGAK